jgi:hypothetical protein
MVDIGTPIKTAEENNKEVDIEKENRERRAKVIKKIIKRRRK